MNTNALNDVAAQPNFLDCFLIPGASTVLSPGTYVTISHGRKFATLLLTGNVLNRKGKFFSADAMAINKMGHFYVAIL